MEDVDCLGEREGDNREGDNMEDVDWLKVTLFDDIFLKLRLVDMGFYWDLKEYWEQNRGGGR